MAELGSLESLLEVSRSYILEHEWKSEWWRFSANQTSRLHIDIGRMNTKEAGESIATFKKAFTQLAREAGLPADSLTFADGVFSKRVKGNFGSLDISLKTSQLEALRKYHGSPERLPAEIIQEVFAMATDPKGWYPVRGGSGVQSLPFDIAILPAVDSEQWMEINNAANAKIELLVKGFKALARQLGEDPGHIFHFKLGNRMQLGGQPPAGSPDKVTVSMDMPRRTLMRVRQLAPQSKTAEAA